MLSSAIELPCGAVLPNRIAKAGMTEGLASPDGVPTPALERLYGIWADGGAGLLVTGNFIIDRDHLERPGNVLLDREPDASMMTALRGLANAGKRSGSHLWVQISHGGRQVQKIVNPAPKSASDVQLALPGDRFARPTPLTTGEIADLIRRWAVAARSCRDAGFTGVQIHAAHGYLVSQFLSPRTNLRTDEYGGGLENRTRFLLEIVAAVRQEVGADFPVSVKLNSADFQKGGFDFTESLDVVRWLEHSSVDLIEISGGNYEQPTLLGIGARGEVNDQGRSTSSAAREAYFIDFAQAMQEQVSVPLMVTGGFRSRAAMVHALESGAADLIGLGRPMCVMTDAPARLLEGLERLPSYEDELQGIESFGESQSVGNSAKRLEGFTTMAWFYEQLWSLGQFGQANLTIKPSDAFRALNARNAALLDARERSA